MNKNGTERKANAPADAFDTMNEHACVWGGIQSGADKCCGVGEVPGKFSKRGVFDW